MSCKSHDYVCLLTIYGLFIHLFIKYILVIYNTLSATVDAEIPWGTVCSLYPRREVTRKRSNCQDGVNTGVTENAGGGDSRESKTGRDTSLEVPGKV